MSTLSESIRQRNWPCFTPIMAGITHLERIVELQARMIQALQNFPEPSHRGSCGPESGCDGICMERSSIAQEIRLIQVELDRENEMPELTQRRVYDLEQSISNFNKNCK